MKIHLLAAAVALACSNSAWATDPGPVTWVYSGAVEYTWAPPEVCDIGHGCLFPGVTEVNVIPQSRDFTLPYWDDETWTIVSGTQTQTWHALVQRGNLLDLSATFVDSGTDPAGDSFSVVEHLSFTESAGIETGSGYYDGTGVYSRAYAVNGDFELLQRDGPPAMPIPEPGPSALLLAGILAFGAWSSRRLVAAGRP